MAGSDRTIPESWVRAEEQVRELPPLTEEQQRELTRIAARHAR